MMLINSYNLGGAEKLVYDLVHTMKGKDNIRVCVCAMKKVETELERTIKTRLESENILCYSIEKKYRRDRISAIFRIRRLVRENQIHILHTHGQGPDFYGRLATIGMKVKNIVTIHSTSGYRRDIENFLGIFTSKYIAVSNETKQYCKIGLNIKKDVYIIENGIDVQRYENNGYRNKKESFVILSVGRIDKQKGYYEMVEQIAPFLKKHQDAIWNIWGCYDVTDDYFIKLQNLICSTGLEGQIRFKGTTLYPEMEYKNADCFLLNSQYEGFGIAYIEAMAAQLPVLGNYVGVIQDIFRFGGKIGLLFEINLEEYLEKIYTDKRFVQHEVEMNKKIVQKLYSLDINVDKHVQLYESAIGGYRT